MRVFVTGGNGFIGSVVVRLLGKAGHQVVCLLRKTSNTDRLSGTSYEPVYGDVRDLGSVQKAIKGCTGVIHLASLSNWNDINSPLMQEVVVEGTRNILQAARENGNLRTVFVSSAAAINGTNHAAVQDENSECDRTLVSLPYTRAKLEGERLCYEAAKKGLPVVIVNPSEVYGPNDTALNTAGNLLDFAKSNPVLVCSGGTSVVHVEDVALGILAALEKGRPGERYILGGENLTVRQLAELTLTLLGQKKRIIQLPNTILKGASAIATKLKLPFPINPAVIPYATRFWLMDNRKAIRDLGLSFRNAEETLKPTIAWLKREHLNPSPAKAGEGDFS